MTSATIGTIPNHYSATLSELDLRMVKSVPPGGNWKDIPSSIPSNRLGQIRESFAAGEGSRSTYYGRLRPDAPAYTISTYFNRPGNGCFIHYDYANGQHRLISQREAARLQSFPDNFKFHGNRTSVNKQIGNAVPPLVAFQIAKKLGKPGHFVDLFSGAGGLGLGFVWAGWEPIVANDIEPSFLETYKANIHPTVVAGDIRDKSVSEKIISTVRAFQDKNKIKRLFILGGPPCQGFSTAGNRRSMADDRNTLFERFSDLISIVRPDGFVFENVTGILNMEKGRIFEMVRKALSISGHVTTAWKICSEEYGVPQRRTRVIIIGHKDSSISPPTPITSHSRHLDIQSLAAALGVKDAISDLPPLLPGQDGSHLAYTAPPTNLYQRFMRGEISAPAFIARLEGSNIT